MKINEENIKKLRDGNATLIADHSKPEMMWKVLGYNFPDDEDKRLRYKYYMSKYEATNHKKDTVGELINLTDFFIEEAVTVSEFIDQSISELIGYQCYYISGKNCFCSDFDLINRVGLVDIKQVGKLIEFTPKTEQERDRQVKELLAMEFEVELPSKFPHDRFNHLNSYLSRDKATLIALLEMRDTYRQGADLDGTDRSSRSHKLFSFQDWSTLDLFEKNFKAELEQVKELIS